MPLSPPCWVCLPLSPLLGHHRAPSWPPWATKKLPRSYLSYPWWCIYVYLQVCSLGLSLSSCPAMQESVPWSGNYIPHVAINVCMPPTKICMPTLNILYVAINSHSSVQFSGSAVSNSLRPRGLQHAKPPCPLPTPRVYSNSCLWSQWCHPTISSSFVLPSIFPSIRVFSNESALIIGVSASTPVLSMNTHDWFPLGWTGWTSLQSKGLSRVYSSITVQKHKFFGAQLSFFFFGTKLEQL